MSCLTSCEKTDCALQHTNYCEPYSKFVWLIKVLCELLLENNIKLTLSTNLIFEISYTSSFRLYFKDNNIFFEIN